MDGYLYLDGESFLRIMSKAKEGLTGAGDNIFMLKDRISSLSGVWSGEAGSGWINLMSEHIEEVLSGLCALRSLCAFIEEHAVRLADTEALVRELLGSAAAEFIF